ncbi:unnamed protein product [Amoebophrya sp. A120]|nr:unnamed protein product [Amoebophrya sp. A120]|eukprot:GSA120T00019646001.1
MVACCRGATPRKRPSLISNKSEDPLSPLPIGQDAPPTLLSIYDPESKIQDVPKQKLGLGAYSPTFSSIKKKFKALHRIGALGRSEGCGNQNGAGEQGDGGVGASSSSNAPPATKQGWKNPSHVIAKKLFKFQMNRIGNNSNSDGMMNLGSTSSDQIIRSANYKQPPPQFAAAGNLADQATEISPGDIKRRLKVTEDDEVDLLRDHDRESFYFSARSDHGNNQDFETNSYLGFYRSNSVTEGVDYTMQRQGGGGDLQLLGAGRNLTDDNEDRVSCNIPGSPLPDISRASRQSSREVGFVPDEEMVRNATIGVENACQRFEKDVPLPRTGGGIGNHAAANSSAKSSGNHYNSVSIPSMLPRQESQVFSSAEELVAASKDTCGSCHAELQEQPLKHTPCSTFVRQLKFNDFASSHLHEEQKKREVDVAFKGTSGQQHKKKLEEFIHDIAEGKLRAVIVQKLMARMGIFTCMANGKVIEHPTLENTDPFTLAAFNKKKLEKMSSTTSGGCNQKNNSNTTSSSTAAGPGARKNSNSSKEQRRPSFLLQMAQRLRRGSSASVLSSEKAGDFQDLIGNVGHGTGAMFGRKNATETINKMILQYLFDVHNGADFCCFIVLRYCSWDRQKALEHLARVIVWYNCDVYQHLIHMNHTDLLKPQDLCLPSYVRTYHKPLRPLQSSVSCVDYSCNAVQRDKTVTSTSTGVIDEEDYDLDTGRRQCTDSLKSFSIGVQTCRENLGGPEKELIWKNATAGAVEIGDMKDENSKNSTTATTPNSKSKKNLKTAEHYKIDLDFDFEASPGGQSCKKNGEINSKNNAPASSSSTSCSKSNQVLQNLAKTTSVPRTPLSPGASSNAVEQLKRAKVETRSISTQTDESCPDMHPIVAKYTPEPLAQVLNPLPANFSAFHIREHMDDMADKELWSCLNPAYKFSNKVYLTKYNDTIEFCRFQHVTGNCFSNKASHANSCAMLHNQTETDLQKMMTIMKLRKLQHMKEVGATGSVFLLDFKNCSLFQMSKAVRNAQKFQTFVWEIMRNIPGGMNRSLLYNMSSGAITCLTMATMMWCADDRARIKTSTGKPSKKQLEDLGISEEMFQEMEEELDSGGTFDLLKGGEHAAGQGVSNANMSGSGRMQVCHAVWHDAGSEICNA